MSTALLVAADDSSSDAQNNGNSQDLVIVASGTWDSATLTLEYSHNGTDWMSSGQTLTANGVIEFRERPGMHWRVTLSGSTTAASITATAY